MIISTDALILSYYCIIISYYDTTSVLSVYNDMATSCMLSRTSQGAPDLCGNPVRSPGMYTEFNF